MMSDICASLLCYCKPRCNPAVICPHWLVGIAVPFFVGGIALCIPVVLIPYGIGTWTAAKKSEFSGLDCWCVRVASCCCPGIMRSFSTLPLPLAAPQQTQCPPQPPSFSRGIAVLPEVVVTQVPMTLTTAVVLDPGVPLTKEDSSGIIMGTIVKKG